MAVRSPAPQPLLPIPWEPAMPGLEVLEPQGVLGENLMWIEWQKAERELADTVPMELGE